MSNDILYDAWRAEQEAAEETTAREAATRRRLRR